MKVGLRHRARGATQARQTNFSNNHHRQSTGHRMDGHEATVPHLRRLHSTHLGCKGLNRLHHNLAWGNHQRSPGLQPHQEAQHLSRPCQEHVACLHRPSHHLLKFHPRNQGWNLLGGRYLLAGCRQSCLKLCHLLSHHRHVILGMGEVEEHRKQLSLGLTHLHILLLQLYLSMKSTLLHVHEVPLKAIRPRSDIL